MNPSRTADTILRDAKVYTHSACQPPAECLAISGGVTIAAGREADVLALSGPGTEITNLGGRTVLPGLTDAHIHAGLFAEQIMKIDCEVDSLEACLHLVQARAHSALPGEWILGHGWNHNRWTRYGTAIDLDTVAPNNPVYLTAKSLHAGWANTTAFERAGVSAATPNPQGGEIQCDVHGAPTGILFDAAMQLIAGCIPTPSTREFEETLSKAQEALWQWGLTGLHDFDSWRTYLAFQALHDRGELGLRVVKNIPLENLDHAINEGLRTGSGDNWLCIGHLKLFIDGALGTQSAAMIAPYHGAPHNTGMLVSDATTLLKLGTLAVHHGIAVAIHAIGDRANREALQAIECLRAYELEHHLPPLKHRIEHVQLLHPDDLHRLAQLNVTASMQPFHAISDMQLAEAYWGERCRYAYAWRTQLEAGAELIFGSDAPVETPNPFLGLFAAVARRRLDGFPGPRGWYPEECISLQDALTAYTINPARTAGMAERTGALTPGMLADLVVLEEDPYTLKDDLLAKIRPVGTMVAGAWRYRNF